MQERSTTLAYNYSIIDSDSILDVSLQHFLSEYKEFYCCSFTNNSIEGLNDILKYSPDVVFINLNDKASIFFQMVQELHLYGTCIPAFIGVSENKNHAYEAIKHNFFDYWLLPHNELDIRKSLLRLKKMLPKEIAPQTICLKSYRDFQYLNTNDILYLRADNNATEFVMKDGTINNAFKTLKTFEHQMPENFIRIHQSYMVNIKHISKISYGKSICTLKYRQIELPFSKSYKQNIDTLKILLTKNTITSMN